MRKSSQPIPVTAVCHTYPTFPVAVDSAFEVEMCRANPFWLLSGASIFSHASAPTDATRSEEHTSELQSRQYLVCRLLLEKKKTSTKPDHMAPPQTPTR